jgi:glyoxylase-like metal-dependent hydrolase (beta-lactamase superfamily II)
MKKTIIDDGIWMYTFEALESKYFPFNVIALVDGEEVMLIDTGFEKHAVEYLTDLKISGKRVVKVVLSHYHPDHVYGLREMEGVEVMGSNRYEGSFISRDEDFERFIPTHEVTSEESFMFGEFSIDLIPVPGHDPSTLWVQINQKWLYVADDLMSDENGEPILPAISHKHVNRQHQALEIMKKYTDQFLIPAHGIIFDNREKTIYEIEDRQIYLNNILNSKRLLSYEEATKGCQNTYLHKEWHDTMHRWE